MKAILNEMILEKFISKEKFSEHLNIDQRDLSKKLKTVENKISWLNDFLEPLDLELIINKKN